MFTTLQLVQLSTNQTAYNAFGLQLGQFLNSLGFIKTTDTGQIDFTVPVTTTGNSDTPIGYEIRTFTDSLSATNQWYIKIEYGHAINDGFAMWFTFGTSTDSGGNLTSQISSRFAIGTNDGNSNPQYCYLSGDSHGFAMSLFDGPNTNEAMFINLERTRDTSGNATGTGLIIETMSLRYGSAHTVHPFTGTIGTPMYYWPAALNVEQSSMTVGSTVGTVSPIPYNFLPFNPPLNTLLYQGTDVGPYSELNVSVYGSNHTYLAIAPNYCPANININNQITNYNAHVLMRFE